MSSRLAGPADAVLEFDRVSFGYGPQPVLREVSLRIEAGSFVALVGANGSGKTTLVRLGLGLLRPAAGVARLFGAEAVRLRERGRLGYVPQRTSTATTLPVSVAEVVRTGLAGRWQPVRVSRREREQVERALDLMGLTGLRRRRFSELSGGQQQRALLARALVTEPRLLVLDEPTTGVDAQARTVLREALAQLTRVDGVAVVYVSHDPDALVGLTERVLEVVDGRVIEQSPPVGEAVAG